MELLLQYERRKTKRVGEIVTGILFARQCTISREVINAIGHTSSKHLVYAMMYNVHNSRSKKSCIHMIKNIVLLL